MDFRWEGAGDLQGDDDGEQYSSRFKSNYVRRRLRNGLPVPVFVRGSDDNGNNGEYKHNSPSASQRNSGTSATSNVGNRKKSLPEAVKEYFSCPICKDPCIEATSTNCGHKFCKGCLEKWRKEKPLCPICSTLITYTHRVYSDDQMIESQLENFSPEVQTRFISAQRKRINALLEEGRSQTVLKKISRKWDDSVAFLRCKNRATIQAELSSQFEPFWMAFVDWLNHFRHDVRCGFLLGAMFIIGANYVWNSINTTFFGYVYLAAKNYDGTIPEEWLNPESGEMRMEGKLPLPTVPTENDAEQQSFLEKLILQKLWWF